MSTGYAIGQMRDRVRVESRTMARDTRGQPQPTWATVCEVWGLFNPAAGAEAWQANQPREGTSDEVVIRYRSDVTGPQMRAVLLTRGDRILPIDSVREAGFGREFLVLVCRGDGEQA